MQATLTAYEVAAALLAVFEGPPRLKAFQDSGGVWTIGRGHTGPDVRAGLVIDEAQSDAWFCEDEQPLVQLVSGMPPLKGGACISFGYNCGRGALHAALQGIEPMSDPRHTTDRLGVVRNGLVSRRRLEILLAERT